jgi:diguanylate cyclase (GGDEF)-like protein
LQSVAPKLSGTPSTWAFGSGGLAVAVLFVAAPPCAAQSNIAAGIPEWMSLGLIAVLFGVLALARWRFHRLAVEARQGELAIRHRIEDLERENEELLCDQEQMRHHAEHDGLTSLWNHRMILQRLRQEVDRSRREGALLSVIMVDLDEFKNVNDTYGHHAGDLVLKEIAAVFQQSVRSYDWVGRYGGEEFLLILPGSSFANARKRAEKFRVAVETARVQYGEASIQITASFGAVSGFPPDGETMIQMADAALYRAKDNGRNCVIATEIIPVEGSLEPVLASHPQPESEGARI